MIKYIAALYILIFTVKIHPQQFELIGVPGANGGVTKMAINKSDPTNIVSADNFGLFISYDKGQTTKILETPFAELIASDLQVFNNSIVLGEYMTGYHQSTDGGETWTTIDWDKNSRKVFRINPNNSDMYYIKKNSNEIWRSNNKGESWYKFAAFSEEIISFEIFPLDTSIIFVAAYTQLYKTTNAGKDWIKKTYIPGTSDMNINPINSNTLYIQTGGVLRKSVDGGETIFDILQPQVYTFKLSQADTSVLFAAALMDDVGIKQGIYKSTDGGLTWEYKMNGIHLDPLSWVASIQAIEINPINAIEVYIGVDKKGVFRTTDGGENWYSTNLSYMESTYFSADSNNPDDFISGNRGWGISKTTDHGRTWFTPSFDISPEHFIPIEHAFDFNPMNKKEGYLGGWNYFYHTTDGGINWRALQNLNYGGCGAVYYHPYSPNIIFLLANQGPYKTTDYGNTWENAYSYGFTNRIRFTKQDLNRMYSIYFENNTFSIMKSTDMGSSWTEINNGLKQNSETHKVLDITALEADINIPDVVYCGQRGGLNKTTNGGESWLQVDSSLKILEPSLGVTCVLLDPDRNGRIYVGIKRNGVPFTSQFTKGGLYLTEDDCKTWRRIFVGDMVGLYSDGGNPRHVFMDTFQGMICFLDTLSVTDIKENTNDLPKDFLLNQNYPNPFNPSTTISYQIPSNSFVTLKIFDVLGKEVAVLVNEVKEPGKYTINFDASKLSSGVYIYYMNAGNFISTNKMILTK